MADIFPSGFCWKCGLPITTPTGEPTTELFCSKKHREQFKRDQERKIIKGKKAGYGITGSTH